MPMLMGCLAAKPVSLFVAKHSRELIVVVLSCPSASLAWHFSWNSNLGFALGRGRLNSKRYGDFLVLFQFAARCQDACSL